MSFFSQRLSFKIICMVPRQLSSIAMLSKTILVLEGLIFLLEKGNRLKKFLAIIVSGNCRATDISH